MSRLQFIATAAAGVQDLLAAELADLGFAAVRIRGPLVEFRGSITDGLRACLWSRIASRVLLEVASTPVDDGARSVYRAALEVAWGEYLDVAGRFAIDASGRHPTLRDHRLAALRVKDAIADQFRAARNRRPDVDTVAPDLRVHVLLNSRGARIGIDLAGTPLNQRGYRRAAGSAPLRENLAAALLARGRGPAIAAAGGGVSGAVGGSGTLAMEAALMATQTAPGLGREHWGFLRWREFDPAPWQRLLAEAGDARVPMRGVLRASDRDPHAVRGARENAAAAGLADVVRIEQRELATLSAPTGDAGGLLATNAPYGERLGDRERAGRSLGELSTVLGAQFADWYAAVLTADPGALRTGRERRRREHPLRNGALRCTLVCAAPVAIRAPVADPVCADDADVVMLRNRLRKRLRAIARWARRAGVGAYRIYDADLPEFAFAIDLYEGRQRWAHVQEYEPPATVDQARAARRRRVMRAVLPEAAEIPAARCVWKRRRRQRGAGQYQRRAFEERLLAIEEGGLHFTVNLNDRIDTGLYPDQREVRARIGALADGRDFLNLFAYTGTASVYAAAGGARSTLSVDLSKRYREWGERNLADNGFGAPAHRYVTADCGEWLRAGPAAHDRFGLIYVGAPTFSNSARMRAPLDLQRDYRELIGAVLALLTGDGVLLFVTHARRLQLDAQAIAGAEVIEITSATVPRDFSRGRAPHRCFQIRHAAPGSRPEAAPVPG